MVFGVYVKQAEEDVFEVEESAVVEPVVDFFGYAFSPVFAIREQDRGNDQGFRVFLRHVGGVPEELVNGKALFVLLKLHQPEDDFGVVKTEQDRHVQDEVAVRQLPLSRFLPEKFNLTDRAVGFQDFRQDPLQGLLGEILEQVFEVLIVVDGRHFGGAGRGRRRFPFGQPNERTSDSGSGVGGSGIFSALFISGPAGPNRATVCPFSAGVAGASSFSLFPFPARGGNSPFPPP